MWVAARCYTSWPESPLGPGLGSCLGIVLAFDIILVFILELVSNMISVVVIVFCFR